jgi:hypothetical protein
VPETPIKPTDPLDWATTQAPAAPKQGRREDGFIPAADGRPGEKPPVSLLDWHAYEMGQRIQAAADSSPRIFTDPIDAIDSTEPGEIFFLDEASSPFSRNQKTSKHGISFTIDKITSDGRRIYYVQNNELIAATARPGVAAEVEWSVNYVTLGLDSGQLYDITTDGQIVAISATPAATKTLLICDATDGTVLYNASPPYQISYLAADSTDSTQRLLIETASPNGLVIWTPGPTFNVLGVVHGALIAATKRGWLFSASGATPNRTLRAEYVDRNSPYSVLSTDTVSYVGDPIGSSTIPAAALVGGNLYWTPNDPAVPYYLEPKKVSTAPTYQFNSGLREAPLTIYDRAHAFDDRFLWFQDADYIYAMLLHNGVYAWSQDKNSGADSTWMASDCRYMWTNAQPGLSGNTRINNYRMPRQRGYWVRSEGNPSKYGLGLLAIPLTRADGGSRI